MKRFPEKDEPEIEKERRTHGRAKRDFGEMVPNFFKAMAPDPEWLETDREPHKRIRQTGNKGNTGGNTVGELRVSTTTPDAMRVTCDVTPGFLKIFEKKKIVLDDWRS